MDLTICLTVLLFIAHINAQPTQQPPNVPPGNACAMAGRNAVTQCFLTNGGYNMLTVIALISNGTQAQLPPNAKQIKASLCQVQRQIVQCIFQNIRSFNNTQQCKTVGQFIRLEQETVGLINGLQQLCGTGLMPPMTLCMRRLNRDMSQCYTKAGLNPNLFAPGASQMQGAVIGDNREIADIFCRNRKQLFNCHNAVLEACPNAKKLQALSGYDQLSMQKGIDILCQDVEDYVSGLVCFQSPTPAVQTCADVMMTQMTDITVEQLQDNLSLEAFYRKYCTVRIDNLDCDFRAWKSTCKDVAVGLKNEFQCSLLPARCKNDNSLRTHLTKTCSQEHFYAPQRIRNGAPSVGTIANVIMTVMTSAAILLL